MNLPRPNPLLPHLPRVRLTLEGEPLEADIALAAGVFSRLRGLILTARPAMGSGLLIVPCNSIHMIGMRYPLEALSLSKDGRVLKISRLLPPWLGLSGCLGARAVLEWLPGSAAHFGVRVGHRLHWARTPAPELR
ncbi:MAG: DUF192 domain-containing protein [Azoarcus sp.]|jgi:uncharacterized membrane protein (UPF0127 family)|nr:DUF192 domain-containing protein [Azoarcus sp.]